jgi:beta-lactamase class A
MNAKLSDYRGQQGNSAFFLLLSSIIILLIGVLILGNELVQYSTIYSDANKTFENNVIIGGVPVGGISESARLEALNDTYVHQPILLRYNGSPILLSPAEIDFELDTDAMQIAANAQVESDFWGGFWNYFWRRDQSQTINVALMADYSSGQLRAYVEELALRYDPQSSTAGFDLATYTFQGSTGYTRLDVNATITLIETALFEPDPAKRVIELPTTTVQGQTPTIETLREAVLQYLNRPDKQLFYDNSGNSAVSVFVIDLQTGEEMGIQQNVLQTASSTIKIGVIANYFRQQTAEPPANYKFLLAAAVICSDNSSANQIMDYPNQPLEYQGIRNVNDTICQAGAVNTKINSHLDLGLPEDSPGIPIGYYSIVDIPACPGTTVQSVDTNITTDYDRSNYTTAADIGTLLMQMYDCAEYGSGLHTIFPEEITQTECRWMIEILRGTRFMRFSELGVPLGTDIAHKVGYAGETFGDAAIVFSPGGDYVFVMYVWETDSDNNGLTDINKWDMIADVSRIVYNYFNPAQPMAQTLTSPNPLGGVECVLPYSVDDISFTDINSGRFDDEGIPLPTACYGGLEPHCRDFDNWGLN